MKIWDKGQSVDKIIENFTVGNDRALDMYLAKYDLIGSRAHATMLGSVGLLTHDEVEALTKGIDELLIDVENGTFTIDEQFEDVHSKVEYELTVKTGDAGKKIHMARSRNDQVLVDLHLFSKDAIQDLISSLKSLADILLEKAEKHQGDLLPGYTHLQVAMPSSFGMWFSAYAEVLIDDVHLLKAAYKIADQNPLGSAAGYGSSFPIDRVLTTELLDFSTLKVNSVAAQMSRGKLEKSISYAIASVAGTLSKMAMDLCLYNSQNYDFVKLPDFMTTGSSIMPHKKNPDVFELIRGKCNQLQALPYELTLLQNNLPSGYHRDYQLLKVNFIPAFTTIMDVIEVLKYAMIPLEVKKNIMEDKKYELAFSVDELNRMVLEGMPFRDAYIQLGRQINGGNFKTDGRLTHTHLGSIGNLGLDQIKAKWKMALD